MKKFLVVMLSLLMVFSFGSTVMAAGPTLTVAAGTDTVLNGDTYYYKAGASNASFNITGTFAVTSGNYYRLFTGTGTALGSAVYATTTATTTLAFTGIELATDATVELWQVDRDGTTKNGSALASCTVKVAKATANAAANALTPIGYRGGNVTTATVAAGGTLTLPATAHGDLTFTTPTLASGLTLKYQIGSVATAVTGNAVPYSVTDTKAIDETIKFWTVNQAGENSDGTVAATTITVKKPALAASLSSLKVTGLDTNGVYKNETDAITNDKAIAITTAGDAKACFTFAVPSGYGFAFKVDGKTVTSASSPQDVVLSDRNTTRVEIIVSKTNEATDTRTFPINLTMAKASVKDLYVEDDDDKDIDLYHKANSSSRQDRGFKTDIYKYYLAVDDAADALYLYPTLEKNKGFKLDVDYFKASAVNEDRNGNWEVLLNSKYDTITMTVSGKGYQSQDYTLNLNNAAGELDDLQVYSGKSTSNRDELNIFPGFNTDTSDYVAFLPYDRNDGGVTVEATANKKTDFLSINGVEKTSTSTTSFDQYIAIDDDDHEEIEIVAGDSTYTVTVYRAANKADEESALSTMDLYTAASTSSGNKIVLTSTSASSSAKKTYTAAVPLNQQYVWVSTRSKDSAAFVIVNGVVVNEQSSKTASTKVTLNKTGNTIITVVGMAEDCKTYEEHVITITRGAADAYLKGFYLSTGAGSLNYSPAFNRTTAYYCTNLPYSSSTLYITPTVNAVGSTIKINGSAVNSGVQSSFNVSVGQSTFDIAVTSTAGNVQHYYLNVLRQSQGPAIQVSSQKLSVNNGTAVSLAAYNIDGYNYLKLRDVAKLLSGSTKQFNVGYDEFSRVVAMSTGRTYITVGGELVIPTKYQTAKPTNQILSLDGSNVYPMAYNIDGNNYFLMRDMALLLNCNVQYNSNTRVVTITTGQTFTN